MLPLRLTVPARAWISCLALVLTTDITNKGPKWRDDVVGYRDANSDTHRKPNAPPHWGWLNVHIRLRYKHPPSEPVELQRLPKPSPTDSRHFGHL